MILKSALHVANPAKIITIGLKIVRSVQNVVKSEKTGIVSQMGSARFVDKDHFMTKQAGKLIKLSK
jgi:hypothetical protein